LISGINTGHVPASLCCKAFGIHDVIKRPICLKKRELTECRTSSTIETAKDKRVVKHRGAFYISRRYYGEN